MGKVGAATFVRLAVRGTLTICALVAIAHTPPVRSRVVAWGLERLRSALSIDITVEQASYNLLTLAGRLRGVSISALDHASTPFLVADEVYLDLSWSVLLGRIGIEAAELHRLRVSLVRSMDGSLNVPVLRGSGGSSTSRLPLGRLIVRDASVSYEDLARDWNVGAQGIALNLDPRERGSISGRFVTARGLSVRVGGTENRGARLDGLLTYDGASVSFEQLRYEAPEGRLVIGGRLDSLWGVPSAELEVSGDLALSQVSSILKFDPAPRGTVALQAKVAGPLNGPTASISLDSDGVSWRHIGAAAVHVNGTVTASTLTVDTATMKLDGGTLSGRGRFLFDGGMAEARADWRDVSAASILGPVTPFPLAARLNGNADVRWNGAGGWSGLELNLDNRSVPVASARDAVTLDGELSTVLTRGEWRVRHQHTLAGAVRIAGDSASRLSSADLGSSRLGGTFAVSAADVARAVPLLRSIGLTIPDWAQPEAGQLDAKLRLGGTFTAPTLQGNAALNDLRLANIGPLQVESLVALNNRRIAVDRFRASLGASQATASGRLDFEKRALAATVQIELPNLTALPIGGLYGWQPSGTLSGDFDLDGVVSRPLVRGSIVGADLAIASQRIEALSARVEYDAGVLAVRRLDVRQQEGGRLVADVEYARATGAYAVTTTATGISLQPVGDGQDPWPISAVLDGDFQGRGTLQQPAGTGRVNFTTLNWGDVPLGPVALNVTLSDAGAHVTASLADLSTTIDGRVQLQFPRMFDLQAEIREADVARLARDVRGPASLVTARIEGRVSARVSATGALDELAAASVEADLQQVNLQAGEAQLQLTRPMRLQYADRTLAVDQLQLRAGSSLIEASGRVGQARFLESLEASIRGNVGDFRPWLSLFGVREDVAVAGVVSAQLSATGPLDRPTLTGDVLVQDGTVAAAGYPAVTGLMARAALSGGVINVTRLDAQWQGAAFRGSLYVPLGFLSEWLPDALTVASVPASSDAAFSGRIDGITAAALAPFVGDRIHETLEGTASGAFDLRAPTLSLENVRGRLELDELRLTAAGVSVTQVRPTRLVIADGRVRVADWMWDAAGSRLSVEGQAALIGARDLDLRAVGQVDVRTVGAFFPQLSTAGLAEVSLNVRGSLTRPLADGTLEIHSGELRVADPQLAASNVNGRVELAGQRLHITEMQGTLNGGRFTATGEVQHQRFSLIGGVLALTGSGIALNVPAGVRTNVDADLTLTFSTNQTRLSGRVAVQRGAYREPLSLAAGFVSAARPPSFATASAAPTFGLERIELDVAIVSSEDLVVDNNYGRMDVGLDLRLVGTVAQPSVVGRAAIREGGVLYLGGRTYQIESGTIDFTNPRALVPSLDLTARTRIAGYDITLAIAGTPETVRATLSSEPTLAQIDIVSLLATGRLADQVGGAGTQLAREQVLGYLSGEALGFAARAIRLDALRLERDTAVGDLQSDPSLIAGEVNPASRLTVSKQFSRYADVVLSQNLREGGRLTWIVTYMPRQDIELRTVSRDDQSRSYEVRHNLALGGPPTQAGGTAATRRASVERVAAIRFAGEPGLPLQTLRQGLELSVGDRIDFYRWQEDRERLRRLYLDRGYLEARVSARRLDEPAAAGGPGTVLEYEIDRGPLARLEIDGHTLPERVVHELETLWSNAVFDEALFGDLESAVRRHLAEDGFLQARVTVSIQEPAPASEKHVRIEILPGSRTRTREIRFEGRRELAADRLNALISSSAQTLEAWLQPAMLVQDVTALYRDEGFLAVRVTAGPAEFSGDVAVLPVRIDEGPAFLVSRVLISGVTARSEPDVRRAFGVELGARYLPRDVESGRRAVDANYAQQGFNAVRSTVETEADLATGMVQVTLTIEEGSRQVLDSLVVDGAGGLHPDVVANAVRLESGTPVDMDVWFRARLRLLDTGLFRRVDIEAVPLAQDAPAPGTVPMQARISVERRPVWQVRYGLNVTDEPAPASEGRVFGGGLTADIQRRSLFGRAGTFGGALRASRDQRIGRTFVTLPSFFTLPVTTNLFVSRSRRHVKESGFLAFVEDKTSFTADQRFSPTSSVRVSYGYQFERNHAFDPNRDPDDPFGLDFVQAAARLTSTTVVDTRDDPFDATRGLFHSSNVEYAAAALGSDVRFAKYVGQQFLYFRIRRSLVTASGFRFGLGRGFGQDLLPNERFFAGGVNTVRGYAENSFGGRDLPGEPRGGRAMVILNQEVRFPIFRWIRGAGFVDAGNVFDSVHDLSFTDLAVGAGAGLRFSTPVGLFRLDLGVPLSRIDERRAPRWHFSFGQMF